MSEIKIKCPTCGKVLRLQDAPNINAATFTCPVCKEKHVVGQCQRIEQPKPASPGGEETQYRQMPPSQRGNEETQYVSKPSSQYGGEATRLGSAPSVNIGSLADSMGRTYQLCVGINTIGRKAETSTASVPIVTADRTMSRSHAIIEVSNAGGKIVHILRNGANKNPSYLNGAVIGAQDQLVLNNGDRIRMGNTELTFKK